MPHRNFFHYRNIKSTAVEAVLFIIMLLAIGHISMHYVERYLLHTELMQMKLSVQVLKNALDHIGNAYDKLDTEIKGISDMAEKDSKLMNSFVVSNICPYNDQLDRRKLHDMYVNDIINESHKSKSKSKTKHLKTAPQYNDKFNLNDKSNNCPSKVNAKTEIVYRTHQKAHKNMNWPSKANALNEANITVKHQIARMLRNNERASETNEKPQGFEPLTCLNPNINHKYQENNTNKPKKYIRNQCT